VERIADASGEATRSGGVLPDDLPRDVAFWPEAAQIDVCSNVGY